MINASPYFLLMFLEWRNFGRVEPSRDRVYNQDVTIGISRDQLLFEHDEEG